MSEKERGGVGEFLEKRERKRERESMCVSVIEHAEGKRKRRIILKGENILKQ